MKFSKLKKGTLSVDQLTKRYRELETEKAELALKVDDLKKSAVYGDVKELSPQLAETRLQIELGDSGMVEIRQQLKNLLNAEVERDYAALPGMIEAYEKKFAAHLEKAGKGLGESIRLLGLSRKGPLGSLATGINAQISDLRESPRAGEYLPFLEAFDSVGAVENEKDFHERKSELDAVENRKPGSPAAENHIRNRITKLIGADPAEEKTGATAPPYIWNTVPISP